MYVYAFVYVYRTQNRQAGFLVAVVVPCVHRRLDSLRHRGQAGMVASNFVLHKVFLKSYLKGQFPHKFVNLLFTSVIVKNKLTDVWGSRLLHNDVHCAR